MGSTFRFEGVTLTYLSLADIPVEQRVLPRLCRRRQLNVGVITSSHYSGVALGGRASLLRPSISAAQIVEISSCLLRPGLSTSPRRACVRRIKFSRNFDRRVFVLEPLVGANSTFRLNYQRSIVSHLGRGAATYMPSSSQSFWGINMLP